MLETFVVFPGGGEPDPVVGGMVRFFSQDEDDLLAQIDCKAAEHRPRLGRKRRQSIKHKFMRNRFARRNEKGRLVQVRSRDLVTGARHSKLDASSGTAAKATNLDKG